MSFIAPSSARRVRSGLDVLLEGHAPSLRGARMGLIAHPASITAGLTHAIDALRAHRGFDLRAIFGPQHGARGEKQDNMIESASYRDARTGLPVHSLYGDVRRPTPEMLDGLDVLVFDLQDVGVRVYTFIWTMVLAMRACADAGIRFAVLERPNPIGGLVREGPLLRPGFESFVGLHPLPLRHGLTTAEIARMAVGEWGIRCDLEVIPCEGWTREMLFAETGLPWVMPSPNLPTFESCLPYPGMVLLEGTNLSEGRGTTRPFELVGAPFLDADELAARLNAAGLEGVHFRPCFFEPTFQKHAGKLCGGVQIHVTDPLRFRSVAAAVALFRAARDMAGDAFRWRDPPYEYETIKPPIDILWGSSALREGLDAGQHPEEVLASEEGEVARFSARAASYQLH